MNLDKNEMFGTRKTDHSRKAAGEAQSWQPIMPVPDSAPLSVFPPGEKPDAVWAYKDAAGNRLFHVARFDRPGGKTVMPRSYGTLNGVTGWHWKGPPEPRPLYGLHALASRPITPSSWSKARRPPTRLRSYSATASSSPPRTGTRAPARRTGMTWEAGASSSGLTMTSRAWNTHSTWPVMLTPPEQSRSPWSRCRSAFPRNGTWPMPALQDSMRRPWSGF